LTFIGYKQTALNKQTGKHPGKQSIYIEESANTTIIMIPMIPGNQLVQDNTAVYPYLDDLTGKRNVRYLFDPHSLDSQN